MQKQFVGDKDLFPLLFTVLGMIMRSSGAAWCSIVIYIVFDAGRLLVNMLSQVPTIFIVFDKHSSPFFFQYT